MEKGIIKNVSIEDFKTNENFVNYVDDDFMAVSYTHLTLPTN